MAIQTTLASIRAPEIHEAIIAYEREALASSDSDEPGQVPFSVTPNATEDDITPDSPPDLCSSIKENPLMDVQWLTPDEQAPINLNIAPIANVGKRRSMYANHTPGIGRGRGAGRGATKRTPLGGGAGFARTAAPPATPNTHQTPIGATNSHFAVNIGTVTTEGGTGTGQDSLNSPLQRRNIQFQFI
ncbi:unnamed protein product [Calypogeia fissa]